VASSPLVLRDVTLRWMPLARATSSVRSSAQEMRRSQVLTFSQSRNTPALAPPPAMFAPSLRRCALAAVTLH
jgi:hypothetical protein